MLEPEGGDQNRGPAVVAIIWIETIISVIVVSLRIWGRMLIRKIGLDDYFMIATLVMIIVFSSISTYLASVGGFRHLFYLQPAEQSLAVKINWISQPFVIFGFATGKSSVALLIIRFVGPNMKYHRAILYTLIVSTLLISTLDIIFTYAQCNPSKALWEPQLQKPGVCWDPRIQSGFATFTAAWNVFDDVVLAVLPVNVVWKLQMSRGKKIGLSVLLSMGLIAAVMGVVKTSYLARLTARSDLTWATYQLYTWSIAEIFVTVFCGSVPGIIPLYDHFFSKKNPRKSGYNAYGSSSREDRPSAPRSISGARLCTSKRYNAVDGDEEGLPLGRRDVPNTAEEPFVGGIGNEREITKQIRIDIVSEGRV